MLGGSSGNHCGLWLRLLTPVTLSTGMSSAIGTSDSSLLVRTSFLIFKALPTPEALDANVCGFVFPSIQHPVSCTVALGVIHYLIVNLISHDR